MLIDPCVWSDLVEDPITSPLIDALEALVDSEDLVLIVTPIMLDEFAQSKARLLRTAGAAFPARESVHGKQQRATGTRERGERLSKSSTDSTISF